MCSFLSRKLHPLAPPQWEVGVNMDCEGTIIEAMTVHFFPYCRLIAKSGCVKLHMGAIFKVTDGARDFSLYVFFSWSLS